MQFIKHKVYQQKAMGLVSNYSYYFFSDVSKSSQLLENAVEQNQNAQMIEKHYFLLRPTLISQNARKFSDSIMPIFNFCAFSAKSNKYL